MNKKTGLTETEAVFRCCGLHLVSRKPAAEPARFTKSTVYDERTGNTLVEFSPSEGESKISLTYIQADSDAALSGELTPQQKLQLGVVYSSVVNMVFDGAIMPDDLDERSLTTTPAAARTF